MFVFQGLSLPLFPLSLVIISVIIACIYRSRVHLTSYFHVALHKSLLTIIVIVVNIYIALQCRGASPNPSRYYRQQVEWTSGISGKGEENDRGTLAAVPLKPEGKK